MPLPDALYARIYALGQFAFPHRERPAQQAARMALHQALARGDVDDLPGALRALGRSFARDINGELTSLAQSRVTHVADQLADQVEGWLAGQKQPQRRAA